MNELSFRHWNEGKMTYSDRIGFEEFYNKYMTDMSNVMPYIGYKDKIGRKIYLKDIIQFSTKLHGVIGYNPNKKVYIVNFVEKPNEVKEVGEWISKYAVEDNVPSKSYYDSKLKELIYT